MKVSHLYKQLLLVLCVSWLSAGFAQVYEKQLLDDQWKFHFGHAGNPEKDFNYGIANLFAKSGAAAKTAIDPKFNDSSWRTLNLPHDWAVELPFTKSSNFDVIQHGFKPVGGLFPETSIGWYRKQFTLSQADTVKRLVLQFDGIFRDANIWVNGFFVGNNKSGYVGAAYDITDYVQFDKPNTLVVRVDATQYEGWFYEGAGIYRHVWLQKMSPIHVAQDGIYAWSTFVNNKATVHVQGTLQQHTASSNTVTVTSIIKERGGRIVAKSKPQVVTIPASGEASITQSIPLTSVRRWSLDDPYLYRIQYIVEHNGQLIDDRTIRVGVRQIDVKPNGVFLNGQHVKLLGTNNHQDHAGVGSALPDYLQYYRIGLLKQMGSNTYRASHHVPTPELLDACDSLGMLVMSEQRLLNSSPEYMDQLTRLVKRYRSRASVFMWSIGNEEGWIQTNSFGKRIAQSLLEKMKLLDPTRTCTYAADLPNTFKGINEVIPVRGFNYRQFAVADYHRDHPHQPIIGTEMGSTVTTRGEYVKDSIRGYVPDQDITAPWWASRAEEWWKLAASNDYWLGGFIWTGFDYRGEPTPYEWPNINSHFGVMDVCGFPKNIYYYYQSWWTDKDVLHISPHWNHHNEWGKPKKLVDVWVNSNADSVELFLNDKSLGRKVMERNSHLQWQVPFEPGTLKAIGYKKGRILTAKQETTGTPMDVVVTPYKTTMLADGKDVAVINISVQDAQDRDIPTADNLIRFSISGPGKIIGVGNGDPSSHEPDKCADGMWQRRLFNGKCQVLVQSTGEAGMIKFEATAAGIYAGGTDIVTVAPASVEVVTNAAKYPLTAEMKKPVPVGKMLGADISFLPELEAKGMRFSDKGVEKDAIAILKDHGFNYVRLRVFNEPANEGGYSPKQGFCDVKNTLAMAKRVKAAGLQLLLDFHYSDYWADPGKQYKPAAWKGQDFATLQTSLYNFTKTVMEALKAQNTLPDMVQVGNEINHGIVWPEGNIQHPDSLAQLLLAGTAAVKTVAPNTIMMMHVALGGQYDEAAFFAQEMLRRGVHFDVLGLSYYPRWHGTLSDLENSLALLSKQLQKDVIVVEYSHRKTEVNKLAFSVPGGRGKGTCIWEPLSTWEKFFDDKGRSNELLELYDVMAKGYLQ